MNFISTLRSAAARMARLVFDRSALANDQFFEVLVEFPRSTLPPHLEGVFLVSMQRRILYELGETAPFKTRLLVHMSSGLTEIDRNPLVWNRSAEKFHLRAVGPHAREVSIMLTSLVVSVLSTTTFDQDGFVVAA